MSERALPQETAPYCYRPGAPARKASPFKALLAVIRDENHAVANHSPSPRAGEGARVGARAEGEASATRAGGGDNGDPSSSGSVRDGSPRDQELAAALTALNDAYAESRARLEACVTAASQVLAATRAELGRLRRASVHAEARADAARRRATLAEQGEARLIDELSAVRRERAILKLRLDNISRTASGEGDAQADTSTLPRAGRVGAEGAGGGGADETARDPDAAAERQERHDWLAP
jgi:chromosome segregation ATPase